MNDHFDAQMRRHLLETADPRPADGQLGHVIDGVAATTQRHPLAARLTWNPGRIGPLPAAAFRYGLIAVALALATVVGASMAGGARQPSSVFEGTWITTDPADGSGMTLAIGPGPKPAVYFEDGYASGPACVNDVVKRFTARGTGEIDGNRLVVTFPDGGGCGLLTVKVPSVYDRDPRRDTLSDPDGVVWTRALGSPAETQVPKAPAPTTQPSITAVDVTPEPDATPDPDTTPAPDASVALRTPKPDPGCIQFDAPGTYTAPADTLTLTVTMPGSAEDPWHGQVDGFHIARMGCAGWFGGSGHTLAGGVTMVATDGCAGASVPVQTTAQAIAAVSALTGIDVVEQTDVNIGGYHGTRFDISHDPDGCPDRDISVVNGVGALEPGIGMRLYLIDVDGSTLAIELFGYPDWDASSRAEVDAILASLVIES